MRMCCLVGPLSGRYGPLVVDCMNYNGVCGLGRSTCLVYRIVRPVLAILRNGVAVCPEQNLIWRVGVLFNLFEVVLCVVPLYEFG